MDTVEDYDKEDIGYSEWVKSVRSLIQTRIKKLSGSMSTRSMSIAKHLSLLQDKYVIVSPGKAPNNIVFASKSHYIDCLIKELGIDNSLGNLTYT
jgi:archaellum component FlaG (FlaF/FlaG flagellin family)